MSAQNQQDTRNNGSFSKNSGSNNIYGSHNKNILSGNNNTWSNNENSFNNSIFNFVAKTDDEGRQILRWLSPLEPQKRHHSVGTDRLDGVGNWVLETSEFRKWRDAKDGSVEQVLFCYGNPGVGKTYVSSVVIDSLFNQALGKDVAVVGLYCDFHGREEQSTTNMFGVMLKQLASRGGIPEHTREAFEKAKKELGGRGLQLQGMVDMLKKTIKPLSRLFICIDALDECTPKHRRELIQSLREILRVSPGTRVFLTGRPHIDDEIVICFSKTIRIPLSPTHGDIMSYLEMRLDSDTDPKAMDQELLSDIMKIIPQKISETFLLVSLNMDAILGEITISGRRKKLDEMTKGEGLGDAYTDTLSRIQAQPGTRSKLGMEVLMWASHAERPLHVDELRHALGAVGSVDLDIGNIPAIETLLECTMGLVTIERSSSTVRLVHYSLQEYLSNNTNLFPNPHSIIAEVCLTYLNFPHVRSFSPTLRSVPSTAPFVEYASCYWGTHARLETTESVKTLALELLDGYAKHISSKVLLLHGVRVEEQPLCEDGTPTGFTGLHGAAYFGCLELTVALLEMNKGDVYATDFHGNTAIAWASKRGNEGVVRALLEWSQSHSGSGRSEYGSAPLLWAAENGNEAVVRILLERSDIDPDKPDKGRRTPLSWASGAGHEGVVRMLLERTDVIPDKGDRRHQTPLSWASESGHESVVKMLLERSDVNPDKTDKWGQTPLSWASSGGHEGVVRMLLERNNVNPNKSDLTGCTPLSDASHNGHEGVVRMLLERNEVDPNNRDLLGDTPLASASDNGHEGVVRILLDRSDVDPNKRNFLGDTPLLSASENGREGVVRILLERNDIDPNKRNFLGETPLLSASDNGHEGIVRILLERNDVDPNKGDLSGLTPLSEASNKGHEGVVRMLLKRNEANPYKPPDGQRRTLRWWTPWGNDDT